jgi:hypothetical protein
MLREGWWGANNPPPPMNKKVPRVNWVLQNSFEVLYKIALNSYLQNPTMQFPTIYFIYVNNFFI